MRTVPVRHAGHDDALDVSDQVFPFVGRLGRRCGHQLLQVAWLNTRQHTSRLDRVQVVGGQVDHLLAANAEFFRVH